MEKISTSLEAIAVAVDKGSDSLKVEEAIKATKHLVEESKKKSGGEQAAAFGQLETELATWQSKLAVILKEPVGQKGMVKHARYWAERLKMSSQ